MKTSVNKKSMLTIAGAIEKHGPGLLVDFRHTGGGQFIAWTD